MHDAESWHTLRSARQSPVLAARHNVSHCRENLMIRTIYVASAVLFLCASGATSAGEFAYACEVSHVYSLANNGSLETLPALEKIMKEHSFSVSRETGMLSGNSLTLDTSRAKSTRVLSRGSTKNSFTAVADFGAFENGTHPYQYISSVRLKIEQIQLVSAKRRFWVMRIGLQGA